MQRKSNSSALSIALSAVGAILGANRGLGEHWFVDALIGGCIGFAIAEWFGVRGRILALEEEIGKLRTGQGRRDDAGGVTQSDAAEVAVAAVAGAAAATVGSAAATAAEAASETESRATLVRGGEGARAREQARARAQAQALELERERVRERELTQAPAPAPTQGRSEALVPEEQTSTSARSGRPEFGQGVVNAIRAFFLGGNSLVRAGVIVLFFGVAFLLRYVAEHSHVPIEFRLAGVAVGALILLALGWWLRKSRPGYALALQGGAVGILNLTIFAALHLYAVLPASAAFGVLAVLAVLSAALAVMQNSLAFALLAVTGGFLAPILSSTGQGSHIVLFSYYAVLNVGIVAIAWFKAWRPLNLAGFVFTFVIGTAWGVLRYRAQDFATTEPFLVLFFLMYVAVAVLFTLRQAPNLRGYVDGTLVFGLPIVAFGLQSAMLHDRLLALAWSAVGVSALYLGLAWQLHRARRADRQVLIEALISLGVVFLTLAVPLALDGRWNAATWALEGCALIWIGCRQERVLPRLFGALLTVAAGCVLAPLFDSARGHLGLTWGDYLGVLTVSAASVYSAATLHLHRGRLRTYEFLFASALFVWGLFWWLLGGTSKIMQLVPAPYVAAADLSFFALTAGLASEFHRLVSLRAARVTALLLLPVMALCAALAAATVPHPLARGGWVAWPFAFGVFYGLTYRHEGAPGQWPAKPMHVGSAWLLCALLSWEAAWQINAAVHGSPSWPAVGWAAIAAVALLVLPTCVTRVKWPFAVHGDTYLLTAGAGLAVYLGLWSLTTNIALRGDADPLPYVPLLNPLDLAQAFALMALVGYGILVRATGRQIFADFDQRLPVAAWVGLAFVWANAVLLRTLHQWFGVAFSVESFMRSTLVQTSISIFWAVLALSTMLVAARKSSRIAWLAGAALLTVVVAKLFLVDLSRTGSIERIVSFGGVGLLMLVVGYWSPLPPAVEARR
jgi:uncharacterized membrane protein